MASRRIGNRLKAVEIGRALEKLTVYGFVGKRAEMASYVFVLMTSNSSVTLLLKVQGANI
jgi:hypothetical protein